MAAVVVVFVADVPGVVDLVAVVVVDLVVVVVVDLVVDLVVVVVVLVVVTLLSWWLLFWSPLSYAIER